MLQVPGLYVRTTSEKGRGVFCGTDLRPGDLIEICPAIVLPEKDREILDNTAMHDYYFVWPDRKGSIAILLGFGSLYNHDPDPNAKIFFDLERTSVEVRCIKDIPAGQEISIDYRSGEKDPESLWFNVR